MQVGRALEHEDADDHERGRSRRGGNEQDDGREKKREQKAARDDERGKSGAAARLDARGRLDVAGDGRGPEAGTDHGGAGVGGEGLRDFREVAVFVEQPRALADADERAHVVEQIDEQERENERQRQREMRPKPGKIKMEGDRRERRGEAEHAGKIHRFLDDVQPLEREIDDGKEEDIQDDRAGNVAHDADGRGDQAKNDEQRFRSAQVADGDERGRVGCDHAAFLQADERDEEADAAGDRGLEIARDRLEKFLAQAGNRQQEKADAAVENHAERRRPRDAVADADGEGEKRVQAHARRERDGVVRHQRHDGGHERRGEAGRGHERGGVHAGLGENRRVDGEDVGHRGEGGETTDDLAAQRGAVGRQVKEPLEKAGRRDGRGVGVGGHGRGNRSGSRGCARSWPQLC